MIINLIRFSRCKKWLKMPFHNSLIINPTIPLYLYINIEGYWGRLNQVNTDNRYDDRISNRAD